MLICSVVWTSGIPAPIPIEPSALPGSAIPALLVPGGFSGLLCSCSPEPRDALNRAAVECAAAAERRARFGLDASRCLKRQELKGSSAPAPDSCSCTSASEKTELKGVSGEEGGK